MIIQHNIMSLNAHRQMSGNTNLVSKNLEKLSSGYKINRAGDDAAGLAISEKMRAQITGLARAQSNAQDGISLVQTAEGALTEVHSMLNRMVDLATQSSNGTMQGEDRQKIQDEITSLTDEIDRISQSTNFNGIKLLDGNLGGGTSAGKGGATIKSGAYGALSTEAAANAKYGTTTIAGKAGTATVPGVSSYTFNYTDADGKDQSINITMTVADDNATGFTGVTVNGAAATVTTPGATLTASTPDAILTGEALAEVLNGQTGFQDLFEVTADATTGALTFTAKTPANPDAKVPTLKSSVQNGTTNAVADATETKAHAAYTKLDVDSTLANGVREWDGKDMKSDSIMTINGKKFAFVSQTMTADDFAAIDKSVTVIRTAVAGIIDNGDATKLVESINSVFGRGTAELTTAAGTSISFRPVEGSTTTGDGLTLQIGDTADEFNKVTVSVADMGTIGLGIDGILVTEQGVAADSIANIKAAIETVSINRSAMGALQNRLEHTINNLGVATENMTAAESRIRDVDMAKEMANFTKNNVLTQAAQAMLAQANQQPQQVLQLLR